jgi:hypothetical protein
LNNVIDHPRRLRRIEQAKQNLFNGIYAAGLESHVKRLTQKDWAALYASALAYELDTPKSGTQVLLNGLLLRGGKFDGRAA